METKSRVRKQYLEKRNSLSSSQQAWLSQCVCNKLLQMEWYRACNCMLVYAAIKKELSLQTFIEQAWIDGKRLFFPKVIGRDMEFYQADDWSELFPGCFGVPEPLADETRCISLYTDEILPMLVPGVAFSAIGQRIGYGKGYYDRYLCKNRQRLNIQPIGIAYAFQVTEPWDDDNFDYPMADIVTEKE